jgi:hypothetical protein
MAAIEERSFVAEGAPQDDGQRRRRDLGLALVTINTSETTQPPKRKLSAGND